MPVIRIKLRDNSEAVYFQSIMGTYSHLAWVRTDDPASGVIKIITTPDREDEARALLQDLKSELDFEEIEYT
jgi:uncharacterized protein DUF4911